MFHQNTVFLYRLRPRFEWELMVCPSDVELEVYVCILPLATTLGVSLWSLGLGLNIVDLNY